MKTKNNIRSIRFSDELAELIDQQIGDNFTQKFENLVTRCVWELPQKEAELRRLDEQIAAKKTELHELWKLCREWRSTIQGINVRLLSLENQLTQEEQQRGL